MSAEIPTPGPIEPKRTPVVVKILIALAILVGLLFVTCVGAGIWFATSEQGQEFINAAVESQSAPGTEALRGIGCSTAMVMEFGQLTGIFEGLMDEEALGSVPADMPFVICQPTTATIACDEVATAYVTAVAPARSFSAQVEGGGSDPCQAFYDADGNRVTVPTHAD